MATLFGTPEPSALSPRVIIMLGALLLMPATYVHADECGNGVIEGTEECDDDNVSSGDGCSSTCALEVPSGCEVTTEAAYISAVEDDPHFETMLDQASGLGYETTLAYPVRCDIDGGAVVYGAMLQKTGAPTDFLTIRSRTDAPEPFSTVVYRRVSADVTEMSFAYGKLSWDGSQDSQNPTMTVLGPNGAPATQSEDTDGDPYPSCGEHLNEFLNCLLENAQNTFPYEYSYYAICGTYLISCTASPSNPLAAYLCLLTTESNVGAAACVFSLAGIMNHVTNYDCEFPHGKTCRNSSCQLGECVVVFCVTDENPISLCDAECQECDEDDGCQATPGEVCEFCKLCQSDGHCGGPCGACREEDGCPFTNGVCCYDLQDGDYAGCCPEGGHCSYENGGGAPGCAIFAFQCMEWMGYTCYPPM